MKRHEQSVIFDQAFRIFWRRRALIEKLIAQMSPIAPGDMKKEEKPKAGALRVAEALAPEPKKEPERPREETQFSARLTVSEREVLKTKDFAQMSVAEIAKAKRLIAELHLPDDERPTRRFFADAHGRRIDPRRTFRRSLRGGGATIDLAYRTPATRHPPLVALVDISGSMAEYSRLFLHFLHAVAEKRRRVHSFVFATRLTNISREIASRDPDEALAKASARVLDWEGERASRTRFPTSTGSGRGACSGRARRCFSSPTVSSDRSGPISTFEMDRLKRSCRRLVWLNPLLRFTAFEPRAAGIRTMLPHVHDFRPIHDLDAMEDLCAVLAGERQEFARLRRKS